jgi:alpha-L-fucosidase
MALTGEQAWFGEARFGMFVHWGAFSQGGLEPSWPLVGGVPAFPACQDLRVAEYDAITAEFDPPAGVVRSWAALAKQAGMQYIVLTTKHHDGYTLFPQGRSGYGIGRVDPERDLVREHVEAARSEGLKVGLYYSLPDWHHPDYPAWVDEMRPYPGPFYPRPEPARWEAFRRDLFAELEHLLSAYGTIDLLWFDGGWERTPDEWDSPGLEAMIRRLQPNILINDRLPGVGDLDTPEQAIPRPAPDKPWETCLTMGESWGPVEGDDVKKSTRAVLAILLDVVASGGNLLLNISPDGQGVVPEWQEDRLLEIAGWMRLHGHTVVGTTPSSFEPWQFHGPTTAKGTSTFLFCTMRPEELVVLRSVHAGKIKAIRAVGTGIPLSFTPQLSALDRIMANADPVCDVHVAVPAAAVDPLCTVIEVVIET